MVEAGAQGDVQQIHDERERECPERAMKNAAPGAAFFVALNGLG
jgi:hypothetical protein